MNDYNYKLVQSWNVKDTENYFHDILNNSEKVVVRTSRELTEEEEINLQTLIAEWYLKKELKRKDNFLQDLLKTIKLHTKHNDFLLQVYIPVGNEELCYGLNFESIIHLGIIQVGIGTFQECLLKGLNHYLTNSESSKAMIVLRGFNFGEKSKEISSKKELSNHLMNPESSKIIVEDLFHFVVEDGELYGIDVNCAARIQEYDFKNKTYMEKRPDTTYKDTNELVAELEVNNLMYEIGMHSLNH